LNVLYYLQLAQFSKNISYSKTQKSKLKNITRKRLQENNKLIVHHILYINKFLSQINFFLILLIFLLLYL
jgi:hypothetical protein